ncbi:MAG: formate/nitrite transporter family protein [Deltaproteobacteria bacterium]|jgi:formate/nitrite transporter|nr:formate/nitrite transporter family protein [Deltaproteobacteria bacterium]
MARNSSEIIQSVINIGTAKSQQSFRAHFILALLAGIYIGFGAVLSIRVTGNLNPEMGNLIKLLFGLLFPVGLLMVLMAGASLFTGDVMYMSASYTEGGRASACGRYLTISYLGNFLGSIFLAFLIYLSKVLLDKGADGTLPLAATAVNLANGKCALPFLTAFVRGIVCNWLVCLAIFMSLSSDDGVSKAILMWPPITAFVALGMEHSVANMFFIPLGLFLGSSQEVIESGITLSASWGSFLIKNLIPVTLGNIVGGAFFVALPYLWTRPKKVEKSA